MIVRKLGGTKKFRPVECVVCLAQNSTLARESLMFAKNLLNSTEESKKAEVAKPKKCVRFQLPTENNQEFDSSFRERLQHNLLYKDDTIFENMEFFQDIDKDELA